MQTDSDVRPLDDWHETLIERGEFKDAELFAKTLYLDKSYKSLILLAKSKSLNNDVSGALAELDRFLQGAVDGKARMAVLVEKAHILVLSGRLGEALKALDDAKALNAMAASSAQTSLDYKIASLVFNLEEYDSAQSLFDTDFKFKTETIASTDSRILRGFNRRGVDKKRVTLNEDKGESEILIKSNKSSKAEYVYFVSGGLNLCQSFAKNLAMHLRNLSGAKAHLHVHGVIAGEIDPGGSLSGWAALKNSLTELDIPLTFTLRHFDIENLEPEQIETVHASEGIKHISEIIEHYDCPVIVSKLDYIPLYDPVEIVSGDYDVALMQNEVSPLDIISSVFPYLMVFNPTYEGRQFAKKLADYIEPFWMEPSALLPGLESAAVSLTYKLDDQTNFQFLPHNLIEFDPEKHHPSIAYTGEAAFIGRGQKQKVFEFSNFLAKQAAAFSLPILARFIGTSGHEEQAISLLDRHLSDNKKASIEEKFEIFQLKALLLSHMGELEEARTFLMKAQRQLPNNVHYEKAKRISSYQLASVNAALGNFEDAQAVFNKNIEIGCDNGWTTQTGIINLTDDFGLIDHKRAAMSFEKPDTDSNSLTYVYFVASDLTYCKKFAPSLIRKLVELSSLGCHLHFHGIALNEKDAGSRAENWAFLHDLLKGANISSSFTLDVLGMERLNAKQKKSVYASERFRILPDLLKAYDCPVIVADIDQLPLKNPQCILQDNVGVQLLRFPKSVLNFLSVTSATVSVFYPNNGGVEFSQKLGAYIENIYADTNRLDWHVDQAALTSVCYTSSESSKVSYLDPKILEQNPKNVSPKEALIDGAVFWSVTNSIKGNSAALSRLEDYNLPEDA